jgi:predicted peptidase
VTSGPRQRTQTPEQGASASGDPTTEEIKPMVDEFTQHVVKDPDNGNELRYNLFTPRGYDARKS